MDEMLIEAERLVVALRIERDELHSMLERNRLNLAKAIGEVSRLVGLVDRA